MPSRVAAQRGLEYEVKAAYLYNIINFVTWPPDAVAGPDSALHVCVYGTDPFGSLLDRALQGGAANTRPLVGTRVANVSGLAACDLVFVPAEQADWIDQVVRAVAQRPVLTIGETPDFLRRGGMIAFVVDGGRVRFDIDLGRATSRGLTISSRLLQVARTVKGKNPS